MLTFLFYCDILYYEILLVVGGGCNGGELQQAMEAAN